MTNLLYADGFEDGMAWTGLSGNWNIVPAPDGAGNVLEGSSTGGGLCVADGTDWNDYVFSVDVCPGPKIGTANMSAGPVFRYQNNSNFYHFRFSTDTGSTYMELYKWSSSGAAQLVRAPYPFSLDTWHTLTVEVVGDTIECSIDAQPLLSYTDTGTTLTHGSIGFRTYSEQAFFDHVLVMNWDEPESTVVSVTVMPEAAALAKGASCQLAVVVEVTNGAPQTVAWEVEGSTSAATVISGSGILRVAPDETAGTLTVTATSTFDSTKSASCEVTLIERPDGFIPVTAVSLDRSKLTMEEGGEETLCAIITPADATDPSLIWTSSAPEFASVDGTGRVTAIKGGSASVMVITADGSYADVCEITVIPRPGTPVTGVSLNKDSLTLTVQESETLIATVLPADADDPGVLWQSGAPEIATVDDAGNVTAKAVGNTHVSVTTVDGAYAAVCEIRVLAHSIPVTGMELSQTSGALYSNIAPNALQLIATVTPDDASDRTVNWTSSAPGVAAVDQNGLVRAVADGTTVISAIAGEITATCTITVTTYYQPTYEDDGGSANGDKDTVTEKNPDGSTTTVTDKKTGEVTITTKYPDGTKIFITTPKEGNTVIEVTVPKDKDSVTVTIPTAHPPKPGEVLVLVHGDGSREIIKTAVPAGKGMKATLTGDAKLELVDNSKPFTDVPGGHWAADAIQFVASRELFSGTRESTFTPGGEATRGMLFTVLARLDGQETSGGETWYSGGLAWAVENGLSDGTYPEANITREQLAVLLYRYVGSPSVDGKVLGAFSDGADISSWASEAMLWAVDNGILQGSGNRLDPSGNATRAEVAIMLQRFMTGNL